MNLDIREINGDVKIDNKIITINNGSIILNDGTIIRSGNAEQSISSQNNSPFTSTNKPTGQVLCEEFTVDSFSTLITHSYLNIDFSIGEKPKVYIEATKEIIDNIIIENNGSELTLDIASDFDTDMRQLNVKVVTPRLSKIITYGTSTVNVLTPIKNKGTIMLSAHEGSKIIVATIISDNAYLSTTEAAKLIVNNVDAQTSTIIKTVQASRLNIAEKINTSNLYITTDQASQVNIKDIQASQIILKTTGAGNIKISGNATSTEYIAGGRSSITADELTSLNGKATTTELARIRCHVTEHFEKHSSILAKIVNV